MSCAATDITRIWMGCKGSWWQRRWICLDRCVVCCRLFCEECLYEEQDHLYCSNCLLLSFDSSLHCHQFTHFTNSELCFYVSLFYLYDSPQYLDRRVCIELLRGCRMSQRVYPELRESHPSNYYTYYNVSSRSCRRTATHHSAVLRDTHHKGIQVTEERAEGELILRSRREEVALLAGGCNPSPDRQEVEGMGERCVVCQAKLGLWHNRSEKCKVCSNHFCKSTCIKKYGKLWTCMSCMVTTRGGISAEELYQVLRNHWYMVSPDNTLYLYKRFVPPSAQLPKISLRDMREEIERNMMVQCTEAGRGEDLPSVHSSARARGAEVGAGDTHEGRRSTPEVLVIQQTNDIYLHEELPDLQQKDMAASSSDFLILDCSWEDLPDDMDLIYRERDKSYQVERPGPVAEREVRRSTVPHREAAPATAAPDTRSILDQYKTLHDVRNLSIAKLKELLLTYNVNIRGCCEKPELLHKAEELWNKESLVVQPELEQNQYHLKGQHVQHPHHLQSPQSDTVPVAQHQYDQPAHLHSQTQPLHPQAERPLLNYNPNYQMSDL